MSKLPLLVVQYEITGHRRRTEHWDLAAIRGDQFNARIFQLKGNTDTFSFDAHEIDGIHHNRATYLGGVLVGYIHENQLSLLETWLERVPIWRNRTNWDCQDWVVDVLKELWMNHPGIVLPGCSSERFIRQELELEKERDQLGHDLIHERLNI